MGAPAIKAIPTNYNGVRFRSRLEAKWAAFFDRCNWRWSYEVNDFDGYIPDFLLHFRIPVFVEVKPLQWDDSESDAEILQEVRTKFAHSGVRGELLTLGSFVLTCEDNDSKKPLLHHRLGLSMEIDAQGDGVTPWDWAFAFYCSHCGNFSFASESMSYHCRARGCYSERDGKDHIAGWETDFDWRRACSEVQWRPR